MRISKINGAILAASMVLPLSLVGCSGESSTSSESGSAASADQQINLTFRSWIPSADQWTELIEGFEKENPNISIDYSRDEDYETFRTGLDNDILAGDVPDIYGVQVGASFDDYAQYALPVEEYASDWISRIDENSRNQTTTSDGVEAAVPILTAGMEYYLYNKTVFDEIGQQLPENYDDLKEVAAAAREKGYSPFAMGAADAWHNADFFVWLSNQFGDGGEIYKAASGEIPWDSESIVKAGQAWQNLFVDGIFQDGAVTTTTYPAARDDFFLARKAIALPTGSWHVGMALTATDLEQPGSAVENDEIGMAAFPSIGENKATATSGVDIALAVSNSSDPEKAEAAAKFVEFMAIGGGQQIWVNWLQGFPVAEGIEVDVADEEPALGKESVRLVTESLAQAEFPRKLTAPDRPSLENDLGVVLQNIAEGSDPKTELATLNQ
ncbi:MAG: ABC transporter substrate-binding protein [Actinomyces sp.]|nr:ABC transporter substrate-binding protein [Actinomyces sp.]